MRIAIATLKRLPIKRKREFKNLIRKTGTEVPRFFNRKLHTLVYLPEEKRLTEMGMHELSEPLTTCFVTYDELASFIRSGKKPQAYENLLRQRQEQSEDLDDNSDEVRQNVISSNNQAIEYHRTEKPILRAELEKKKLTELKEIASQNNVDLTHKGRLTKRVIAAKIIDKLIDDEDITT